MSKAPHPPFERMRRDADSGEYRQLVVHEGRKVEVRILAESRDELEALLPAAQKFWKSRARWFKEFREYAANELLDELNGCLDCGEDDPPVITAAALKKMLKAPFSVVLHRDEDDGLIYFEMSGGEDEALQDNCIEVSGTMDEGITDGEIVTLE